MTPTVKDLCDALVMHASKVEAELEVALARVAEVERENADLLDERHALLNQLAELQGRRVAS